MELKPDVIIMDLSMSETNGFEPTRQILQNVPEIKESKNCLVIVQANLLI